MRMYIEELKVRVGDVVRYNGSEHRVTSIAATKPSIFGARQGKRTGWIEIEQLGARELQLIPVVKS